jgi:hypothetical protein
MRKLVVGIAAIALSVVLGAPAGAIQPPPHCDPGACIDPIEVVEDAACYVGARLGLQCID